MDESARILFTMTIFASSALRYFPSAQNSSCSIKGITQPNWCIVMVMGHLDRQQTTLVEGQTLVINCTLINQKREHNTVCADPESSVYFRDRSNRNYSCLDSVQAISTWTFQLRLPNITVDHRGHFYCYLQSGNASYAAINSVSVDVYRAPLKPGNVSCVVGNWTSVECHWTPSLDQQMKHVKIRNYRFFNQSVVVNTTQQNEQLVFCAEKSISFCQWPLLYTTEQWISGQTICVQVRVTVADATTTSDMTCFELDDIVRFHLPPNVTIVQQNNPRAVALWWSPPFHPVDFQQPIIYRVTLISEWPQDAVRDLVTRYNSCVLEDLRPNTNYLVSVEVQSKFGQAKSEAAKASFRTPPSGTM